MSSLNIIAGFTSSVDIFLDIENAGDNAFQAILSFILPASTLQLVNVFNQTRRGEVSGYMCVMLTRAVKVKYCMSNMSIAILVIWQRQKY